MNTKLDWEGVGEKHGHWVQVGPAFRVRLSQRTLHRYAVFECECGRTAALYIPNVITGKSTRCLDCKAIARTRHGLANSPEYQSWVGMRHRCLNPGCDCFENYGGRGITICERWIDSVETFIEDMGPRPSLKHSIDRIDVNGNYEPSNCRWATPQEQTQNRRNTRYVMVDGERRRLWDECLRLGIKPVTVWARMRNGMSPEEAIADPRDLRRTIDRLKT